MKYCLSRKEFVLRIAEGSPLITFVLKFNLALFIAITLLLLMNKRVRETFYILLMNSLHSLLYFEFPQVLSFKVNFCILCIYLLLNINKSLLNTITVWFCCIWNYSIFFILSFIINNRSTLFIPNSIMQFFPVTVLCSYWGTVNFERVDLVK